MTDDRLPDFLVIGAAKSGTMSLFEHLREHPQVYVPPEKEVRFFDVDDRFALGPSWNAAHFRLASPGQVTGEATPGYLASKEAPARIADLMPAARLIALLRDPVDRAYSHYWHAMSWAGGGAPFADFVDSAVRGGDLDDRFVRGGRYADQLARYAEHFAREQIHVQVFERVVADAAGSFTAICRFLGVPELVPPSLGRVFNRSHKHRSRLLRGYMEGLSAWRRLPRPLANAIDRLNTVDVDYPPMPPDVRARLADYFAPHNERLASEWGLDLSRWSRPQP